MTDPFDDKSPIYLQLVIIFKEKIANGTWPVGGRVDTVRDLAVQFRVNPNTVQRALAELEREKLVFSERTSGRFITSDEDTVRGVRDHLANLCIREYADRMSRLGYGSDVILKMTEEYIREKRFSDNRGVREKGEEKHDFD
ncbi:MAG: GntR family transcriptional regulator [Clostridiaceae bacterium]|nr:GntR family transcriptional regulator [Clostridiaceae bacterium]